MRESEREKKLIRKLFSEDTKNQEEEEEEEENCDVQDEEITTKKFLYYSSVHLVAYSICILIVIATIVTGFRMAH